MLLAVTSYEIALWLHLTAAIVGFGSTFAMSITFPVAMKAGARHLPYVHRLHVAINSWFAAPALLVVLATGLYQVEDADLSLGDAWLSAGFAIVFVLAGLIFGYFLPTDRKLGEMAEREIAAADGEDVAMSDDYQRRARMSGLVGSFAGLLIVAAVYIMVTKPGA